MSDMAKDEIRDRLGNIDQIRDIIFGAQLRDYDNRLDKVETDAALLKQEAREQNDQLRLSVETEVRAAIEMFDKRLRSVQANAQEECSELRQQIDRLNKKFTNTIQSLDESVDRQFDSMHNELAATKTKLQTDVGALRDLVLEELDRRFSQLQQAKASKDDIAETLFELGMRIKGSEFIPTLKQATETTSDYDPLPLLATRRHEETAHVS